MQRPDPVQFQHSRLGLPPLKLPVSREGTCQARWPDGTQFRGTLPPYATEAWFTYNWPEYYFVAAEVVPTTPGAGPHPSRVKIERPNGAYITYWISISNLTNQPVSFEAHYDILGR